MSDRKSQFVDQLFKDQGTALVKFLTSQYRDPDQAREIAQEAWLRIYRLDHPEALDNPRAFLFQTANNLAIDRKRRQVVELRHAEEEALKLADEESVSVEQTVEARESVDRIAKALEELPEKCQRAFVMHRTQDLSYAEIALELGVSVSMVEKYIIRALKHFRNKMT